MSTQTSTTVKPVRKVGLFGAIGNLFDTLFYATDMTSNIAESGSTYSSSLPIMASIHTETTLEEMRQELAELKSKANTSDA